MSTWEALGIGVGAGLIVWSLVEAWAKHWGADE